MTKELYNLAVYNVAAYRLISKKLRDARYEAYSLTGTNFSDTNAKGGVAGNASYQKKINEYIDLERNMNSSFKAVVDALSKLDNKIKYPLIKSIVEEKYVPCGYTSRELIRLKMEILETIAINLVGKEIYFAMETK